MVTVNKYLYRKDFGRGICPCSNKQEYKVLFREVSETWIAETDNESIFLVHPLWSNKKIFRLAESIDMANTKARILRDFHLEVMQD